MGLTLLTEDALITKHAKMNNWPYYSSIMLKIYTPFPQPNKQIQICYLYVFLTVDFQI